MLKSKTILLGVLSTFTVLVPITTASASIFDIPKPIAQISESILNHLRSNTSISSTVGTPSANAVSMGIPVGAPPAGTYSVETQPSAGSCHYRWKGNEPLPDHSCTPGALNPDVTQANIALTICKKGYTSTIRPSSSVTGQEKKLNALSYGYTGSFKTGEYDHLVSLELGGSPNDSRNLWIEPQALGSYHRTALNDKDKIENILHKAICSGQVSLSAAQVAISSDWTTALKTLGLK